jgi:hypothetical protein
MNRIRLVVCAALIALVLAAGALFCLSCSAEPSKQAQIEQPAVPTTLAETTGPSETADPKAAAEAAIKQRVRELDTLLDTLVATGKDKTKDLQAFLLGTTEQQRRVTNEYLARWADEPEGNTAVVMPGTCSVVRISLNADLTLARVVTEEKVRLAEGKTGRCVESAVWVCTDGVWRRTCYENGCPHDAVGVSPLDLGTELDGMTWDVVRIEESPNAKAAEASNRVIVVTVVANNLAIDRRSPGGYALALSTSDGTRYEVSSVTSTLLPATAGLLKTAMEGKERRPISLAFEVPRETELADLQYEIAPVNDAAAGTTPAGGQAAYLQPRTPQAWALATSAMLQTSEDYRHDLLTGLPPEGGNVEWCKSSLERWWGVGSRADLQEVLSWLKSDGHRLEWNNLAEYVASASDGELSDFASQLDANAAHSVEMVQKYAAQVGSKSILGFDLCRYVAVCRWGCLCGYLTEDEAWDKIMPVAAKLQATFSSWQELGQNYLIGREFWSYEQSQEDGGQMEMWINYLVTAPGSPWGSNPWDLDLGVEVPTIR